MSKRHPPRLRLSRTTLRRVTAAGLVLGPVYQLPRPSGLATCNACSLTCASVAAPCLPTRGPSCL